MSTSGCVAISDGGLVTFGLTIAIQMTHRLSIHKTCHDRMSCSETGDITGRLPSLTRRQQRDSYITSRRVRCMIRATRIVTLDTQRPTFCRLTQRMDAVCHWYRHTSEVRQIYNANTIGTRASSRVFVQRPPSSSFPCRLRASYSYNGSSLTLTFPCSGLCCCDTDVVAALAFSCSTTHRSTTVFSLTLHGSPGAGNFVFTLDS